METNETLIRKVVEGELSGKDCVAYTQKAEVRIIWPDDFDPYKRPDYSTVGAWEVVKR